MLRRSSGRFRAGLGCILLGNLTAVESVSAQSVGQAPREPSTLSARNSARIATFAVPAVWQGSPMDDVTVQVASDGEVAIDSRSLRSMLLPLLNQAGIEQLDAAITGVPLISIPALDAAGISVIFDMARLELRVVSIAPLLRPVENIERTRPREAELPVTDQPAHFSAYLNSNVNLVYRGGDGILKPEVFWLGAARLGRLVVEGEAGLSETFNGYRPFRQGVRAVYDEPDKSRRWLAGDLRLQFTPLTQLPMLGGVALLKSRRTFNPSLSFRALGGQRILIETPSTVVVLVNGAPFRTLDLQPGTYDLSDLPVETGANNIQINVRDAAGRETTSRLDAFFDPPDLETGEDEYTLAAGVVSDDFGLNPRYNGSIAALASYRRTFSDRLLVGGSLQMSGKVQIVAAEARLVPQVVPGSFDLEAAVSRGQSTGVALRGGYRWFGGSAGARQSVTATVDYQSAGFTSLSQIASFSLERLSANLNYSRALSLSTYVSSGGSYTWVARLGSRSTVFADINRRLTDRLVGTLGAEYGSGEILGRSYGIRAGIALLLGGGHRADVSYQSRRDFGRATFSRGAGSDVGSLGYSLGLLRSFGSMGIEGTADYIGNRFDARLFLSGQGDGFGRIVDRRTARLQFGTSVAYAGGMFGVGRPINDSFFLARPAQSIERADAVVGRNLRGRNYEGASGPIGAAVANQLQSFETQEVQYDLRGEEQVYDVGAGQSRVRPPYRSGYAVVVGSSRYVSVLGHLQSEEKPVALISGTVEQIDDPGFQSQPFFTNSVGRFGIIGLAPGARYLVKLADGRSFKIDVPAGRGTLLRMNDLTIPPVEK